jgi:hypothetical protein
MGEVGVGQPGKSEIGTEIVECLSRFRNGSSLLVATVVIVTMDSSRSFSWSSGLKSRTRTGKFCRWLIGSVYHGRRLRTGPYTGSSV